MTPEEETIENNRQALKYMILGALRPELKKALHFQEIFTAHVVADKLKDTITSSGYGKDEKTGEKKTVDAPNTLTLSANKSYEDVFIGMFVDQIEDFDVLHEADLVFQFAKKDEKGKRIERYVNTCIKYIDKSGKKKKINFKSVF